VTVARAHAGRRASARDVAARVLVRVEKDRAFASAALDAELARTVQLDARDRSFATELVYGSLRVLPWLSGEIARFVPRGIDHLDARVRADLLVAAYQLFFTRVPAFAAVSEAVDAVSAARGAHVASFANAVLRRVAERAASIDDVARSEAVMSSAAPWLREALERALTREGAVAFLREGAEAPAVSLRVEEALAAQDDEGAPGSSPGHDARVAREKILDGLRQASPKATFEAGRISPLAVLARGAGNPRALPGWQEGAWSIQEEGSQLAALAVGARVGDTVLDACAGRGNKAGVLARAVAPSGAVDVCDASPAKLERLAIELARVGLHPRASFAVDWTVGSGEVKGTYDRVLVDAPCSGVGTLRRRPEIALRREAADLVAVSRSQIAIATRVADHVRPGGRLVFVVCSVLREEAEDVVDALLRQRPDFVPAPFDSAPARALFGDAASFRLLPHVHGTDGYFAACLARRDEG
jgi:16S rRNA (cytosine967-C5)-methyltransferase